jgi:hypothetical protein
MEIGRREEEGRLKVKQGVKSLVFYTYTLVIL